MQYRQFFQSQRLSPPHKSWLKYAGISTLILAVLGYWLTPVLAKFYLNHFILADIGNYTGRVERIRLNLLHGSYVLKDLTIFRVGGNQQVPFFKVKEFSVYLSWEALTEGAILVSATLNQPQLNFLDAKKESKRQSGAGGNWLVTFENLIPTTLHELKIQNGKLSFQNFDTQPKVELTATQISGTLTNLTNVKDKQGKRVAEAYAQAQLLDNAEVTARAKFDPFDYNDFDFAAQIKNLHLPKINSFSQAYGNIDFEDGSGDVFCEIKAQSGEITGYIKPLFSDVNILSWKQDVEQQQDNPLQLLWEGGLGFVKTLFTSADSEQVASKIEISGSVDQAKIDSWQAIASFIKNAFSDALEKQFDHYTSLTK